MKILMVCLGNICRSPLAEGITRHLVSQRNLNWEIDSAGTTGWHEGTPPDERSVEVALDNQIDISQLRARKITPTDLQHWDLIITMDSQNYQDVRRLNPNLAGQKVHLVMNFLYPGQNRPVPDPYYGSKKDFEDVYDMLYAACAAMLDHLESKSKSI